MNKRTLGITFVLSFLVISGLTTYHLYSNSQMQKEAERQKIEQLKRELADSSAFGKKLEPIYSMPKKLSKSDALEEIEDFFKQENFKNKTPKDVKKIKKLAMRYNIKLGEKRKLFLVISSKVV